MNEQRKVIYALRQQILEGRDLRPQAVEWIRAAIDRAVDQHCADEFPEDWSLDELLTTVKLSFPTTVTLERLKAMEEKDEIVGALESDALAQYEAREEKLGRTMLAEIERRVMLSMIDRYWREHLYEMDYLQEGINLRAMGQKDPLTEWQREGFDMFEAMMGLIQDDFVRYVFHLEVTTEPAPQQQPRNLTYQAPEDPVTGAASMREAAIAEAAAQQGVVASPAAIADAASGAPGRGGAPARAGGPAAAVADVEPEAQRPVRVDKTPGRNDPCHCGSGKKYKFCHGRQG
jgi:preprotein translocase subunit SecA